jgi:conjugative transposon TraM protein
LDKVLKIQHPEMVTPPKERSVSPTISPAMEIPVKRDDGSLNTLAGAPPVAADTSKEPAPDIDDGFIAFDDNNGIEAGTDNTIRAVVDEDQTLVSGATIKLRLTEGARVNGVTLPKDNFVYGTATLNNERLLISIKSVICGNSIYPVNWQVFDLDGMAGVFIPGAISRDVSKESAAEGINSVGVTSLDASLGGQAANAGIQAAKNLFSKKIKLVRVSVKAGYEVLLKESKLSS